MKISIIIPSRERCDRLRILLNSLLKKTNDLANLEIIITTDIDDPQSSQYLALIQEIQGSMFIRHFVRERSHNLSEYINIMASQCTGDVILGLNDDTVMQTDGWDRILRDTASTLHPGPVFLDIHDSTRSFGQGTQYSCFPAMNRICYEALGFFFHKEIHSWPADFWIYFVCLRAGIVYEVKGIEIFHDRRCDDKTHQNVRDIYYRQGGREADNLNIISDINRLIQSKSKYGR